MRLLLVLLATCVCSVGVRAEADVDYTMTDHGIPITIEQPSGHHKLHLRYHLAHYGAVPYGQEFSAYASININCPSITAD